MNKKELDEFLSWGRYLYWSDILRCRFDEYLEQPHGTDGSEKWYFYALMSQWYASVRVVIEGWLEMELKDNIIDGLINGWPDYCDLLRKYRNCVYHYQETSTDDRFVALLRKGDESVYWIRALHDEFQRYFWEMPERITKSTEQINGIRETIQETIGWLPNDIMPVHKHDLEKVMREGEEKLAKAGDYSSPEAIKLLDTISKIRKTINEAPDNPLLNELYERKKSNISSE